MVPTRQTLIEMGRKQPLSTIQTENLAAAGVVKKNIIQRKSKSMDFRFHWLICRESQEKIRFYWDPGHLNWVDYSTKHHPPHLSYQSPPQIGWICQYFQKEKKHQ